MKQFNVLSVVMVSLFLAACQQSLQNKEKNVTEATFLRDSLHSLYTVPYAETSGGHLQSMQDVTPFITKEEASKRIQNYKDYMTLLGDELGQPYDPKKDIYGFVFSLDNINKLLQRIKNYNQNAADTLQITGLRVYQSRRPEIINEKEILMEEVFILPTIGLKNFYNIDPDFDGGKIQNPEQLNEADSINWMVLDASIPCPNNCQ